MEPTSPSSHESQYKKPTVPLYLTFDLANGGLRFANYIIDLIAIIILNLIWGFTIGLILGILALSFIDKLLANERFFNFVIGILNTMIFYTIFEGLFGKTPGKLITKTKVVDENGKKPDIGTIMLRSLCRLIPFEAFSFLGSEARGWHDTISKT